MQMKTSFSLLLVGLLAVSCASGSGEAPAYGDPVFGTVTQQAPVVETTLGQVRGENRAGIAIFRGIPYGAPCDGAGRFLPPAPARAWEGVRDCTQNGPIAMQGGQSISGDPTGLGTYFSGGHRELFGVDDEVKSENCLVLDVLSPGLDGGKRPVVVYIHGGGFATGSGTLVLGADRWAREENLVIVGVNHRLNVFGYLYLGHLDAAYASSGMAGMLDLVLALQWVRDNIAAFGGDPAQVTIMGESGGGMKVSTLMAMAETRGLYCRAIVESGSNVVGHTSVVEAAETTGQVLKALNIDPADWRQLLTVPAEQLLQAAGRMNFSPVPDGIHLDYQPSDELKVFPVAKDIPLLVGSSADEMGVFMAVDQLGVTAENLTERVAASQHLSEEQAAQLLAGFEQANHKNDEPWHTFVKVQSLGGFLGGGAFRQAMAKARQGGAPVFHYLVEYDTPSVTNAQYRCAWHTADLPLQMRIVLHPEQEELSRQMAHAWAAFIRTGNPSTERLVWPAFTAEERNVMVFDEETGVEQDPLRVIREAFERVE